VYFVIFRSGDVQAVAAQLQGMKTSLEVLKSSPDFDDKLMHLEALKNRLETSVSPAVVAACIQHNTEQAKQFHKIFSNIERVQEFSKYYLKCHRGRIGNKWQEIVNGDDEDAKLATLDHPTGSSNHCELLLVRKFYELLLHAWHSESQWCTIVFGKEASVSIVVQLLLEVTLSVDSGPAALISSSMSNLESDKLLKIIAFHEVTRKFTVDLHKAMLNTSANASSVVCDEHDDLNVLLSKLSESLWFPFVPNFLNYAELETEALLTSLSAINLSSSDLIDLVQVLDSSVKKVFHEANSSIERCSKFTGFLGAGDLVLALERYFNEFCDRYSREIRTIAISCGLTSKNQKSTTTSHHNGGGGEDWTLVFQHCVRVITTCGRLLLNFADFEGSLGASLLPLATERHLITRPGDGSDKLPWQTYDYLKLGGPETRDRLCTVLDTIYERNADVSVSILAAVKQRFTELNQQAQKLTFDVAFAYVKRQLSTVALQSDEAVTPHDDVVAVVAAEMPRFSVSPSERTTHVGEYLMTLPQHLESFSSLDGGGGADDDADIDRALEVALLAGRLPFAPDGDLDNMADQWLSSIIQATEHSYVEAVTHISRLTPNGCRQIVADLDYMANVVDSLGMCVSGQLNELRELLDAANEDEMREKAGKLTSANNSHLVDVVCKMRGMSI